MKTYTRRDSCTALLKKMGIDKTEYNQFITSANGLFYVDLVAAEKLIADRKAAAEEAAKPKSKKSTTETDKPAKVEKESCSSVCRDLIRAGKTNAEIWAIVKTKFNLGDNKKHYPAWYRADLARKGEVIVAVSNEEVL